MCLISPIDVSSSDCLVVATTVLTHEAAPYDSASYDSAFVNKTMMKPYCDDTQFYLSHTIVGKRHCGIKMRDGTN